MNKKEKEKLKDIQFNLKYTLRPYITEEYRKQVIENVVKDIEILINEKSKYEQIINEDRGLDEHFESRYDLSSYNNDPTHY